jgi:hypothetical protein
MRLMRCENGRTARGLVALGTSIVLVYGCGGGVEPPRQAQQAGPPQASVPPAVSINALMVDWIDHSSHALWNVEQEGRAPQTDADWREVARHATQLTASGTLVSLGGTGVADPGWARSPDWQKYSQELTSVGAAAFDAAGSRNLEALVTANGRLVDVCEKCHQEFKPDLPTEGRTHQPD